MATYNSKEKTVVATIDGLIVDNVHSVNLSQDGEYGYGEICTSVKNGDVFRYTRISADEKTEYEKSAISPDDIVAALGLKLNK